MPAKLGVERGKYTINGSGVEKPGIIGSMTGFSISYVSAREVRSL
ncbi:MAG: hypothetical protein V4708_04080 [Bacteroidota bacterium]